MILLHYGHISRELEPPKELRTLLLSKFQTALEKRPAATRYKKQVEMIKNIWMEAILPNLNPSVCLKVQSIEHCNLLVDEKSNETTTEESHDHRKRKCTSRKSETDTSDEHNGFETLSKDGDERQDEHGVFLTRLFETATLAFHGFCGFECLRQLHPPLVLELGNPEQSSAHQGDDDCCNESEDAFPDVLSAGPAIFAESIEGANYTCTYNDADD